MPQIAQTASCPAIEPAPITPTNCIVFDQCTQKVAMASLTDASVVTAALGSQIITLITGLVPVGTVIPAAILNTLVAQVVAALLAAGAVQITAGLASNTLPTLEGTVLKDAIVNCGTLEALITVATTTALTVSITIPITPPVTGSVTILAGLIGCTRVAMVINEATQACGVRPTDCIFEQVTDVGPVAVCETQGSVVDPITGGVLTTTLFILRAPVTVRQYVVRQVLPTTPVCAPGSGPCVSACENRSPKPLPPVCRTPRRMVYRRIVAEGTDCCL
jgi:hypothetical protein